MTAILPCRTQSLLPLQPGMGVVTCGTQTISGYSAPYIVMGVIDFRNPPTDRLGVNWNAPMYHGPDEGWTSARLGQVFGVCLDDRGNIYVTATTSYGTLFSPTNPLVGPGGPGAVYKIDGHSGDISIFAALPNTGPALGNICYDQTHSQFFVSNFEDGRVYRISGAGAVLEAFDPHAPDDGQPGFAPLGERPWGVGVYGNRLYYSIWWEPFQTFVSNATNEIRSVGIGANGEFLNDDRHEFSIELMAHYYAASPVSDIAFSTYGTMLLAERTMTRDDSPSAHQSRLLRYSRIGSVWRRIDSFQIGNYYGLGNVGHNNSAGGVDFGNAGTNTGSGMVYGAEQIIWASGDALRFPGRNPDGSNETVYGVTRIPASGNTVDNVGNNSYFVDLDGNTVNGNKTQMGDVEVLRASCAPYPISISAEKYRLDVGPSTIADEARIDVSLAFDGRLVAELFSTDGTRVGMLANGWLSAGPHRLRWNTTGVASGLYFVRVSADRWSSIQPIRIVH